MVSGFVIRCWLRVLPLSLSALLFTGCGMMSVLADEDAGEATFDAGDAGDTGVAGDAGGSIDTSVADAIPDGCGDGIIDGRLGEDCDSDYVGGVTCASIKQGTGVLGCNDHCRFDLSLCTGPGGDIGDGGTGDGGPSPFGDGGIVI